MRTIQTMSSALIGAAFAVALGFAPGSALAGHRHDAGCGHGHANHDHDEYYDDWDNEDRDDHGRRAHRHPRSVAAPTVIFHADVRDYRPYYLRSAHYAPHRHDHAVYAFPHATSYGVVYRQVAYCREPQGLVAFYGPRFGIRIGF